MCLQRKVLSIVLGLSLCDGNNFIKGGLTSYLVLLGVVGGYFGLPKKSGSPFVVDPSYGICCKTLWRFSYNILEIHLTITIQNSYVNIQV